ncbi:MAG: hypothetical protein QOG46_1532, partial [Pseudonocardiales bacterium]|nr:hypothetical protein [Pseudonocardiales bacterium]
MVDGPRGAAEHPAHDLKHSEALGPAEQGTLFPDSALTDPHG